MLSSVRRYQLGYHNSLIEKAQKTQWPKEKGEIYLFAMLTFVVHTIS